MQKKIFLAIATYLTETIIRIWQSRQLAECELASSNLINPIPNYKGAGAVKNGDSLFIVAASTLIPDNSGKIILSGYKDFTKMFKPAKRHPKAHPALSLQTKFKNADTKKSQPQETVELYVLPI